MKYLNKIVNRLNSNKVTLENCNLNEIKSLEAKINKGLPICYKEFLESMGKDTDATNVKSGLYDYTGFEGESIFYDNVYGDYTNKDGLIEQLEEDGKDDLLLQIKNDNVFVFSSHQGYIYAFFKLDEGDNPPVYGYHEGQEKDNFPKLTDTLLEFFEKYLEYGKDPYDALDE
ncbi:SMI1/KNR4 family protein [Flavobacterium soli]|uniref:SMI1/KNR4 family protein n=1 Tax=Flavobacterium soli TaxID=344881 RepID=UPI0004791900|nr:SMI1/KNR4 family protein [Flavobacterium soli]